MKHILFPTVAAADAFIADLQARGAVKPELGSSTLNRRAAPDTTGGMTTSGAAYEASGTSGSGVSADVAGSAEDAGAGAVKGTVVGALTGTVAAVVGTVATVATGGLALPVVLGMAALGSGVGAAVGGIGGAAGVNEAGAGGYQTQSDLDDDAYNRIDSGMNSGGRAVAVDENVPQDILDEAVRTHGGHFI